MPAAPAPLACREVIVIPPQHLARHTVEEAAEAAERAAGRTRVAYHAAPVLEKQQIDSHYETQMEVDAHYVQVGRPYRAHQTKAALNIWM